MSGLLLGHDDAAIVAHEAPHRVPCVHRGMHDVH